MSQSPETNDTAGRSGSSETPATQPRHCRRGVPDSTVLSPKRERPAYPPGYSVRHALRSPTLGCLAEEALARVTGQPPSALLPPPIRLWSDQATWQDLLEISATYEAPTFEPQLDRDWAASWTVTLGRAPAETTIPLAQLTASMVRRAPQARVFSFNKSLKARSGVQGMTSIGRDVPFETRMEQRALVALDFHRLSDARSQPFRLLWTAKDGNAHRHTPDYFISTRLGHAVIDVRLASIVGQHALRNAAALSIACAWLGWDYYLITGLIQPGYAVVDALHGAAIAHPRTQSEYGDELLRQVRKRPNGVPVSELVSNTKAPAFSRFALRHLLWHRLLAIDINDGLYDSTLVFPARVQHD
jgi:hypothetical protein